MNWKHLIWIIPAVAIVFFLLGCLLFQQGQVDAMDLAMTCYCEHYNINSTYCELQTQFKDDLIQSGLIDGMRISDNK